MRTLAVVGGGVIGLSAAWRAAVAGFTVTLFDPAVGSGSSWVAGGMLAPLSEGWPGEDAALEFGAASLVRWPKFAADLREITGTDVFVADQTLTVALDAADAADLRTIADFVNAHDLPGLTAKDISVPPGESAGLRLLDRAGVRAAEPSLGRGVRAGLLAVAEPAVDNRALVGALRTACAAAGVEFRAERVAALSDLPHDRVVLAAGAAAAELWPGLPVRPVKGEILRLRRRPSAPTPPTRVIRARVHGRPVYLVPRGDGIVLGATQYEVGFDSAVTVAGVRDLITDAEAVLPGIGEYEFAEAIAGARPGSPDNLPLIGYLDDRVIVAAGHGRNGILDTPVTADAVLALLTDGELPQARAADPHRFAAAAPLYPGGVR
ncbi:glycine oxidase ThiO [Nocardia seriolae]|uniref:glycine oxidase n=2 Tax=Nocardia seriolae TaxID=37332 RepID=A0A0B8NAE7_9NOCA|nr:glycine oxidase ThiO [Nocardia seriolae]APA95245.1 Glycine oxidase [Nocardia seriolae]MTJ66661.1 glycine oxidase ThiO [Nocardia seriolae]MTJ72696.1 glycine oxidase ThiO [Nocardia seriolae]MTJ85500.1 glycine oxidase ThiO [Nocardia seriolae]MTK29498.1 glycine oxidase ThiO [Nocardia seriolae]